MTSVWYFDEQYSPLLAQAINRERAILYLASHMHNPVPKSTNGVLYNPSYFTGRCIVSGADDPVNVWARRPVGSMMLVTTPHT